jgi:hypothetical protein
VIKGVLGECRSRWASFGEGEAVCLRLECEPFLRKKCLRKQTNHGRRHLYLVPFAPADEELSRIESELERLTCTLPRESIIRQSLSKSFTVRVRNLEEAISFSNGYAPEHLIVNIKDAARYVWTNGLARLVPLP